MIAKQGGRCTVPMLIKDVHLNKHRNIVTETRYLCEYMVGSETLTQIVTSIDLRVRNRQKREDYRQLGN